MKPPHVSFPSQALCSLRQRLCLSVRAVQQPHIQYRLALLLAALLVSILGFLQFFQPAHHPLISGLAELVPCL